MYDVLFTVCLCQGDWLVMIWCAVSGLSRSTMLVSSECQSVLLAWNAIWFLKDSMYMAQLLSSPARYRPSIYTHYLRTECDKKPRRNPSKPLRPARLETTGIPLFTLPSGAEHRLILFSTTH